MKKYIKFSALIMLGFVLSGLMVNVSWAEEKKAAKDTQAAAGSDAALPFKAAVIDRDAVFKQSKAMKALRDQLQAKWAEYNKKFQEEQKSLYAKSQKMVEEKSKLTASDLKNKEDEFQKKQNELSQQGTSLEIKAQEEKQKLNEAFNTGFKDIEKEFNTIVMDYAQKNKITFLAMRDMVILNDSGYDVTDAILQELDKKMPTYKVKFKD